MISLFRYIFSPKTLKIGSMWVPEDSYENPFKRKIVYKVVDVKKGFVKYEVIGSIGVLETDSTELRSFYAFRREIKD